MASRRPIYFAGISISDDKEISFHVSGPGDAVTIESGKKCVWFHMPGSVYYRMVKVPKPTDKYGAAQHLLTVKEFKGDERIVKFLKELVERLAPKEPTKNGRKSGRKGKAEALDKNALKEKVRELVTAKKR